MFKVTDEIKQKFVSTKKIDWRGAHLFTATDRRISHMIFDISTSIYRNSVIFNPNYNYYISSEKAVEFELKYVRFLKYFSLYHKMLLIK